MTKAKLKTKQLFQILLLTGTLVSLAFVPWILVKAWILPLPDTIQEQMEDAVAQGFEGMIVYVDQRGKSPQFLGAGWHNREAKIPAHPHAYFKIASISKLYDAVAMTKLVGAKRLALDKSIAAYLPDLVGKIEYADQITLRMLIQHRSGIPNFTDTPDFWASPTESYEESLALIAGQPAQFEPDADYAYCNTNYLLINKIMNEELGYDNFKFIQDEILIPLGLRHTYNTIDAVNIDSVMSGYHVGYPDDLKEAGRVGMIATAQDVGRFLRALNDGTVFKTGEQEVYASVYEFDHGGWVPGYQSFANYNAELDAVVVSFYNTTDPDLYNWNLSEIINTRIFKILENQGNN